ncbi:MAG: hypothetical protein PXZ08_05605 [Actinomycetota bacterium]|nr:hypothetical protein [Actinomycetota bacterium]
MVELTASDLGRVLSAVQAVSTAQDPGVFGQLAIEQVASLIPSEVVTFNEIDAANGQLSFRLLSARQNDDGVDTLADDLA